MVTIILMHISKMKQKPTAQRLFLTRQPATMFSCPRQLTINHRVTNMEIKMAKLVMTTLSISLVHCFKLVFLAVQHVIVKSMNMKKISMTTICLIKQ